MLKYLGFRAFRFSRIGSKILSAFLIVFLLFPLFPTDVFASAPKVKVVDLVVLLVDEDLVSQASIKSRISRYAEDVQKALEHQAVIIPINKDSSALGIHELLAQYYFSGRNNDGLSRLKGAILIGDLPLPVVEKGGNYWPTIFPYTDFENKVYEWDYKEKRFVFKDDYLMAPEIWHSLIRSNKVGLDAQVEELEDFFDNNHKVHEESTEFSKKVFYANFEKQKKIIPAESFFRYKEWIKYAEPIQYLRFTKHFAKELVENQKAAGIGSGIFGSMDDDEKEQIATDIAKSEEGLSKTEVLESLNADTLKIMPDVQSKQLIDNFAQRYFELYTHWITEVNERVGMADHWKAEEIDTTPSLVSRKDEASVLVLRYFNDLAEESLVSAFEKHNVAERLFINHEVPVVYKEDGGSDADGGEKWEYKPFYWNGVYPKDEFKVEDCTLIRGVQRDPELKPLAQQVEANNTLDIESADQCKHVKEPGYPSDPMGGCCAKNIKYENGEFDYEGCVPTSAWLGGESGKASLYHHGAQKKVLNLAGTREIKGVQGGAGCLDALHFNEAEENSRRFSTLMIHDEPKPGSIMDQVEAQFTRALPVDDPRGFSLLDHGRDFSRLKFPNVFNFRETFDSFDEFEAAVRISLKSTLEEVNDLTNKGNAKSIIRKNSESGIMAWPPPPHAPPPPQVETEGAQMDCSISSGLSPFDDFTMVRVWTRFCEEFKESSTVNPTTGAVTTSKTTFNNYTAIVKRYYEQGESIPEVVINDFLKQVDLQKVWEALVWIDKNIEEKNREVFEVAMGKTPDFQSFFYDTESNGYEVVEILGKGSHENGLELAFSPLQIKADREFEEANEGNGDEDLNSLCEGIPSRPELDMEYLKAKEKFIKFQFKDKKTKTIFLGKDLAKTFLNTEKEDKCAKIPSTMLYWPSKIACSAKATASGGGKKLFLGENLGTTKPFEPIIESHEVDIKNKKLVIEQKELILHTQSVDPVEVRVKLLDINGDLQDQDFSTQVELKFNSSDAARLFKIAPAQSIPLSKGEAVFFLMPQTSQFGGKIEMTALATRDDSKIKLVSEPTPILVTRYGMFGLGEEDQVVVKDSKGVVIKTRILDQKSQLTYDMDGELVVFETDAGDFVAGENKVKIKEGQAEITLMPGKRAGKFKVYITDPTRKMAATEVKIELLPEEPASIYLSKKSTYLVQAASAIPITAKLLDQYGNTVYDVFHKWSWQWSGLNVESPAERDTDPRVRGIQEFTDYSGESNLLVASKPQTSQAQLSIGSDYWENGNARSLSLTVIKDPVFAVHLDKTEVIAGEDEVIKGSIKALTAEGKLIPDDFTITMGVLPIKDGAYPDKLNLVDGTVEFEFTPGTLSGKFKLFVTSPGFISTETEFEVLPGRPEKLDISRVGNSRYAAEFDSDKPIELKLKVLDEYRNVVPTFSDKINLKATDITSYLVDIPEASKEVQKGSSVIEIWPQDLSGKVRLIADHPELSGDTMELELVDFFRIKDVQKLSPKSVMTLIFGFEAGDLRDQENFANSFLHAGNTQAVASLTSPPIPSYQHGSIAGDGRLGNEMEARLVHSDRPEFLIETEEKILTQQRLYFAGNPKVFLNDKSKKTGIYFDVEDTTHPIVLNDQTFFWKEKPLFRTEGKGGITLLSGTLEFKSTDNLFVWDVEFETEKIGRLQFLAEEKSLKTISKFASIEDFVGLQIRKIDTDIYFDRVFVDPTTNGVQGIAIYDQNEKELRERKLGADFTSAESLLSNNDLVWNDEWKPGTILGAFNSIGISTQWGSSDALILYGDPSLKLRGENEREPNGLTQDIGRPLWRSDTGTVQKIIGMDINNDGNMDVLNLLENTLYALYQTDKKRSHFRDTGPIIKFTDGVISLAAINLGNTENPNHKDLIQLNSDGALRLWENTNEGVFKSKKIVIDFENPIESFQVAKLNTDEFEDLIVVDTDHKMWAVYGHNKDFLSPVFVKDLSPSFEALDESFEYGIDDYAPWNLKYSMFGYEGLRQNDKVNELEWNRFVRPTAPAQTEIAPEDLETLLLNDYYNTGGPTMTDEAVFVRPDDAPFLNKTKLTTSSEKEKVKPGDRIDVKLEISPKGTLKNFRVLPASADNNKFLEETLRCVGCGIDPKIYSAAGDGFAWFEIGNVSGKVTLTWQEEVSALNTLKFFVGDFDNGFDDLDDVTLPWLQDDKDVLMQFKTQKKQGDKTKTDVSPYPLHPEMNAVSKQKLSLDLIQNLSEDDLRKRADELFGKDSDIDNDNLPYEFDHYNSENNYGLDKLAALNGKTTNFNNLLKSNNQDKRAKMLMGGGNCFNQPESVAPSAPGLLNDHKVPHAKPKGKQNGQYKLSWLTTKYTPKPVPSTAPTDKAGERTEPHPFKSMGRTYVMPTSTGKVGKAICLGSFPVHMAAPKWAPNCFVSTPPVKFMKDCSDPENYKPKTDQLLCAADSYVKGSHASSSSGSGGGRANAKSSRGGKKNSPLTGTNATSFQNMMSGIMNNDKVGKGNASAGSLKPKPDFVSDSRTNPLNSGGKMQQNLNNLMADIVNVQHQPVPVSIPSTSPSEMKEGKKDFKKNQKELTKVMNENIPPKVLGLKDTVEETVEGLSRIEDSNFSGLLLPEPEKIEKLIEEYKKQLSQFRVSLERDVCGKTGKQKTCESGKKMIREANARLQNVQKSLTGNYKEIKEETDVFNKNITSKYEDIEIFKTSLETYAESLESPIEARHKLTNHMTQFEQNFKSLDQAAGSGAQKILKIRDLENKIVSSTAQMVQQYQKFHKGWMAKNQQRENQWKAQASANKEILSMMQTVPQIYIDFSNNCQTGTVDRATLFPWLTDHVFEKGASRKVINLPTTPNAELDGRAMSPAKLDLKLPTPQVTQVPIGNLPVMDDRPDVPEYKDEIEEGSETFNDFPDLNEKLINTKKELENWKEVYNTLRKTQNFFPVLDEEGNIVKKGNTKAILPFVSTNFEPITLSEIEALMEIEIPELVEAKPLELPFVPTLPTIPGGSEESFKPDIPNLPMDQLPFLPPPPKMDNLTCGMLNNLKVPLSFLNLECMIRLGVAPVSEWYVKPHTERRTNRSALSKNKDFTSKSIKPGPFTGNPNTMSVAGKTKRNDIFKGNHDKLKGASGSQQKFIQSNSQSQNTPRQPAIPSASGKPIKTSFNSTPVSEWKKWVAKGKTESEKSLDPVSFLKALKYLSTSMPTYVDAQTKIKEDFAAVRVPENNLGAQELAEIDSAFENYLAKLETYRQEKLQETKRLRYVYEQENLNFFENTFVQSTLDKDKRFLAANTDSALDFSIPKREFKTTVAKFEPPVKDTAKFDKVPDDFKEKLETDDSANSCSEGVEPGIYYGEGDRLNKINKLPHRGITAYAVFDLDDDGVKEVLYGIDNEVYVKRKSGSNGTKLTFNIEFLDRVDLSEFVRPVDTLDRYDYYEALNSDFVKHKSLAKYTEWEFSERPDQIFEIHKSNTTKEAEWKKSLGIITRPIPVLSETRITTAQIVEIEGNPSIKSPIKIPLLRFSGEACTNENIVKPFVESGMVMAIEKPAKLQVVFPPTRGGDGRVELVSLKPGEEIYLEGADVCLYEGSAWFTQYDYFDEYDFWKTNQKVLADEKSIEPKTIKFADGSEILVAGRSDFLDKVNDGTYQNWRPLSETTMLAASQLRLKEDESVILIFNNGEKRVLTGPMEYYFQIDETNEEGYLTRFPAQGYNQIYSQISSYTVNQKSYTKPQFFPIIQLDEE